MSFFSTWHDVRSLGIDDSAFIKNFIERSEISLAPLNDGSEQEIVDATGKSIATVKRLMKSLQDKNFIRRESGNRYGKWEVLV